LATNCHQLAQFASNWPQTATNWHNLHQIGHKLPQTGINPQIRGDCPKLGIILGFNPKIGNLLPRGFWD
jgi:hypothetical protein